MRVKLTTAAAMTGAAAIGSSAPADKAATPRVIPPPSSVHWTAPRPRKMPDESSGSSR